MTENSIALCDHCTDEYLLPMLDEYRKLHHIKAVLAKGYKEKKAVDAVALEKDTRVVLDFLVNVVDSVQLVPPGI